MCITQNRRHAGRLETDHRQLSSRWFPETTGRATGLRSGQQLSTCIMFVNTPSLQWSRIDCCKVR
ncbi:hypothetical protein Plhal304r1_c020g0072531 [Plasmopara halstedii]